MKAVVFHGIGNISLDEVPDPALQQDSDAIVRLTASAICGTDLHMVRGTIGGMQPGTILGHEGVGIFEEVGRAVRNLRGGDRVLIPSTISCGCCSYCRAGYTAQCDTANPNGSRAGTAFFGGLKSTGPIQGLQAEYARTPFANASLIMLPDSIDDDRAILMSDIFLTDFFDAQLAGVTPGKVLPFSVPVLPAVCYCQRAVARGCTRDDGGLIARPARNSTRPRRRNHQFLMKKIRSRPS